VPGRPAKAKHASHSTKETHASVLSDYGRRIVAEAKPVTAEDLAGRHLLGRCCALPSNDVLFHPSVWHPQEKRAYPAMVAVITDILTVEPISLHFTFLDPAGGGKAKIEQPRRYLYGHRKVGVVRLTPDHEITQGLVLGEGLETCLSYALEYSGIWACLDAGNLGAFPVLPGIEGLTVLIDHDEAGHRAFGTVRDRYRAAGLTHPLDIIGIEVKGKPGDDINDLVRTA
jgi:putative DNA primase/helicase